MADTGYNWDTGAHVTYNSGTDVDDLAVADEATLTSDEIDLDGKAACEISVKSVEDNTGACDGDVYVYVLRPDNDPDSEGWQDINDALRGVAIDQAQNTTKRVAFSVDPGDVSKFKILVDNDCGQEVAITININTATIAAAS